MARVAVAPQPVESMTDRQLQRREALLAAVMQLALERGIDNVQMKSVAERSGVALGTTYRYFASKEHLLASALVEWQARLTDLILLEPSELQGDDQRVDRIVDFLHRGMRGFQRYPSYADLMIYVAASRDPYARQALEAMSVRTDRVLRLYLGPQIAQEPFDTVSFTIGSVWLNAILQWRSGRDSLEAAYANLENGVRLACAGLRATGTSGDLPDRVA
jgi:TetR/AcrR family transcriptional regulator, cholesterol catabolism regulator